MNRPTEGWTWLVNTRKWHYFRDGRPICGGVLLLLLLARPNERYERGNDTSPPTCAACKRKLAKEKQR